ncbi:MAG: GIY-YIG nuclease family protein [Candidatus Paceibacterota bacterium]|jgi:putative endonuclease
MSFVYMIHDQNNRLYVGVSDNPERRLRDHNRKAGATFTHEGGFRIVFLEKYNTLKDARSREVQIKKWRREKKETLISRYVEGLETK